MDVTKSEADHLGQQETSDPDMELDLFRRLCDTTDTSGWSAELREAVWQHPLVPPQHRGLVKFLIVLRSDYHGEQLLSFMLDYALAGPGETETTTQEQTTGLSTTQAASACTSATSSSSSSSSSTSAQASPTSRDSDGSAAADSRSSSIRARLRAPTDELRVHEALCSTIQIDAGQYLASIFRNNGCQVILATEHTPAFVEVKRYACRAMILCIYQQLLDAGLVKPTRGRWAEYAKLLQLWPFVFEAWLRLMTLRDRGMNAIPTNGADLMRCVKDLFEYEVMLWNARHRAELDEAVEISEREDRRLLMERRADAELAGIEHAQPQCGLKKRK
ncbi:Hypothetical protein UVM_LOCUS244 [uncultured virus]|nr:Hypothetical protein UVM_LOCUS244 [uncultured virus]